MGWQCWIISLQWLYFRIVLAYLDDWFQTFGMSKTSGSDWTLWTWQKGRHLDMAQMAQIFFKMDGCILKSSANLQVHCYSILQHHFDFPARPRPIPVARAAAISAASSTKGTTFLICWEGEINCGKPKYKSSKKKRPEKKATNQWYKPSPNGRFMALGLPHVRFTYQTLGCFSSLPLSRLRVQGRTLPYSMPHPYAYNCAPDHTRSFLAPAWATDWCGAGDFKWWCTASTDPHVVEVRQSNNGEQIFGNGWKQGAAAAARRQGERNKHSAGKDDQACCARFGMFISKQTPWYRNHRSHRVGLWHFVTDMYNMYDMYDMYYSIQRTPGPTFRTACWRRYSSECGDSGDSVTYPAGSAAQLRRWRKARWWQHSSVEVPWNLRNLHEPPSFIASHWYKLQLLTLVSLVYYLQMIIIEYESSINGIMMEHYNIIYNYHPILFSLEHWSTRSGGFSLLKKSRSAGAIRVGCLDFHHRTVGISDP